MKEHDPWGLAWAWAVVDPNRRLRNQDGESVGSRVFCSEKAAKACLDEAIVKLEEYDEEPSLVPLYPERPGVAELVEAVEEFLTTTHIPDARLAALSAAYVKWREGEIERGNP